MIKLDGYELIIGSSIDPQFGPVLLFGSGGQLVEVYRDRALALPPLNTTLARRMMEQTRIFTALKGVRGRNRWIWRRWKNCWCVSANSSSRNRWIKEMDINPLAGIAGTAPGARRAVRVARTQMSPRLNCPAGHSSVSDAICFALEMKDGTRGDDSSRFVPRTSR